jgi:putative ABC transport system permease protein
VIVWFKIAVRNLVKNRRRSIITIFAVAFGFAGVNLFAGFTEYMYTGTREAAILVESRGHLTIFTKGFLEKGQLDPARYLLTPEKMKAAEEICREIPHVMLVTPQLRISGIVTNGKVSTIFLAQGIVPSTDDALLSRFTIVKMEDILKRLEGRRLEDDKMYGVAMSSSLARLLDLKVGSNAVAFSSTVDGQMNALDLEVFQLIPVGNATMKDKIMRVPLSFAQALYDWYGADRLSVLLDKTEYTESIRDQLQTAFSERGLELEVKTWKELSDLYRKVKEMFDIVFIFLFIIVFIIVVMSVANTMSMTVFERTREIGTLRALGLKRKGVMLLFGIESSILGVYGTIGGLFLTVLGWWLVSFLKPTWVPPGMTNPVPIIIYLVPETMVYSFVFLLVLCLTASLIPARRAAQKNVVGALAHV